MCKKCLRNSCINLKACRSAVHNSSKNNISIRCLGYTNPKLVPIGKGCPSCATMSIDIGAIFFDVCPDFLWRYGSDLRIRVNTMRDWIKKEGHSKGSTNSDIGLAPSWSGVQTGSGTVYTHTHRKDEGHEWRVLSIFYLKHPWMYCVTGYSVKCANGLHVLLIPDTWCESTT